MKSNILKAGNTEAKIGKSWWGPRENYSEEWNHVDNEIQQFGIKEHYITKH